jgi:Bacterial Ig-like domain
VKALLNALCGLCCTIGLAACGGGSAAPTYSIAVTVSGLSGTLVLQNNNSDVLSAAANGVFTFASRLLGASAYAVTVKTQPTGQTCVVANGTGIVNGSNVTNVTAICSPVYTVGGSVTGLLGTVTLQDNGGNDLTIASNRPFAIGPALATGTAYSITIKTQPVEQLCVVSNGSGTVSGANIGNVAVTCSLVPLTVAGSSPVIGAINVVRNTNWIVVFSTTLAAATISDSVLSLTSAAGPQAFTFTVSGNQITLLPSGALLPLTEYTLTIGTGIQGALGEQLASTVAISMTTEDRGWETARAIETNTAVNQAFGPTVAFGASGDALAIWYQYDGTRYNIWSDSYSPVSNWGTSALLHSSNLGDAVEPRITIDASGDIAAIWRQTIATTGTLSSIYSKRYTVAGGWGIATAIENNSGSAAAARVAGDSTGNAIAVWFQFNETNDNVWTNRFTAAGNWGTPVLLQSGTNEAAFPQIAMSIDGAACAVWDQFIGTTETVWANDYSIGNGWIGASLIQNDSVSTRFGAQVGIDATGNCLRVWQQVHGPHTAIFADRYAPGGAGSAPVVIGADSTIDMVAPQIAVDANGDAQAVWLEQGTGITTLWADHYSAAAGWETSVPLQSITAGSASNPDIAVDAAGNALAVWEELSSGLVYVWANRYVAGRGWGTAQLIGPRTGNSTNPRVAFDSTGRAIAVWEQIDSASNHDIWADLFD